MKVNCFGALVFSVIFVLSKVSIAQNSGHKHHHHEGHKYELGLSLGLAHLADEEETAFGAHLHMMRRFEEDSFMEKISVGLGVEYLFTEHTHISFLATVSWNPIGLLILDFAPGVLYSEHEEEHETQFIFHMELTYEFDLHSIGIGPVIGIALSEEDTHYMAGIHIGKGL